MNKEWRIVLFTLMEAMALIAAGLIGKHNADKWYATHPERKKYVMELYSDECVQIEGEKNPEWKKLIILPGCSHDIGWSLVKDEKDCGDTKVCAIEK
jgi:hypothetical protein